ncbi:MAG: hypothetical protein R3175_02535 [Marinobacter sp.]|uniref:hypothetical protein n=1 Tax=Marinobacter sp. TaxID=50741 RepID=UPI00299EA74D|nr:hypothetical protein [Marinobacter sp.]MDX1754914.1 hypothetical protein [Marinobacter sp.]
MAGRCWLLGALLALMGHAVAWADPAEEPAHRSLGVAGISSAPGDDEPRVLHILPWQPPRVPRRPESELSSQAPELLDPINPRVFERHRKFRDTLDPNLGSRFSLH